MNNRTEIESTVREHIAVLKSVPERRPQTAARARARFLAQAIVANEIQQNKGWRPMFRKERFALNMLVSLLVIAALFIGAGTTVQAAQNDLPGQPLYGLKTLSEDVSLQFEPNPQAKVERLMDLAQTRVEEMTRLIDAGQTPPDQVEMRLQQHLQQALQICSDMDGPTLEQTLLQLRTELEQQDRDMQQLQTRAPQNAEPLLERTRTLLETRLQLIDEGLANHEAFRDSVRTGIHQGQTQTPPAPGKRNGPPTPRPDKPGKGNGLGPNGNPGGPNPSPTHVTLDDGMVPTGSGKGSGNQGGKGSHSNPGGNGSGGGPGGNGP